MLTNQAAFRYSVTASYSDTFHELPGVLGEGLYSSHQQFDVLFVPSFSAGSLSVGVIIYRMTPSRATPSATTTMSCGAHSPASGACVPDTPTTAAAGTPALALGRFVRDDVSGEMLLIMRPASHAGGGAVPPAYPAPPAAAGPPAAARSVMLFHYAHRSTCHRERTLLVCDGVGFCKERVADFVTTVQETTESRFCPVCGAPPNAGCACELAELLPAPAAHAMEHRNIVRALQSHAGGMLGQGRVICTPRAEAARRLRVATPAGEVSPVVEVGRMAGEERRLVVSPALVSRIQICGFAEEGEDPSLPQVRRHWHTAEMLRSFAVKLCLASTSPTKLVVPAAGLDGGTLLTGSGVGGWREGGFGVHAGVGGDVVMDSMVGGGVGAGTGCVSGAGVGASGSGGVFGSPNRFLYNDVPQLQQSSDQALVSEYFNGEEEESSSGGNNMSWSLGRDIPQPPDPITMSPNLLQDPPLGLEAPFPMYSNDGDDSLAIDGDGLLSAQSPPATPATGIGVTAAAGYSLPPSPALAFDGAPPATPAAGFDAAPTENDAAAAPTDKDAAVAPNARPPPAPRRRRGGVSDADAAERESRRVARNRLAAARSNARRKQKNDGLKDSLRREHERIAELRVRQAELAAANEVLRVQVSGMHDHDVV